MPRPAARQPDQRVLLAAGDVPHQRLAIAVSGAYPAGYRVLHLAMQHARLPVARPAVDVLLRQAAVDCSSCHRLLQMQAAGVDHVQFCLAPATPHGVEALAGVLEKVQ